MKNNLENQDIKTDKPVPMSYEALKAERDALEQRVNALAVENAALKTAHPQPFGREMMKALDAYEKHQDEVPETGLLDAFFILRDSIRVETPATDAALAAIEAQGVEQFIAEMLERGNDPTNSLTERVRADMRSAATFARLFIELREAK